MKWYKMDCDAHQNLDMRCLIAKWGWDWYGRYWAILGMIGKQVKDKKSDFALRTNDGRPFPVELLADDLGTTVERLTNFCKFLSDARLIDAEPWEAENLISCRKMAKRADEYSKRIGTISRQCPDIVPTKEEEEEEEVEKEKEKEKEKSSASAQKRREAFFVSEIKNFEAWRTHCQQNTIKTGRGWEDGNLKKLFSLSNGDAELAMKTLQYCITRGWKALFPLPAAEIDAYRAAVLERKRLEKKKCEYCDEMISESQRYDHQREGVCIGWRSPPVDEIKNILKGFTFSKT